MILFFKISSCCYWQDGHVKDGKNVLIVQIFEAYSRRSLAGSIGRARNIIKTGSLRSENSLKFGREPIRKHFEHRRITFGSRLEGHENLYYCMSSNFVNNFNLTGKESNGTRKQNGFTWFLVLKVKIKSNGTLYINIIAGFRFKCYWT